MTELVKHPMRWLCVHPGDYADVRYKGTIEEKAAVLDDFVDMFLKNQEPQILYNKIILARSHAFWDNKVTARKNLSKKGAEIFQKQNAELKELKAKLGSSEKPTTLFDTANLERPTREQAIQFAETIGATLANEWFDWSVGNNWCDKGNRPIRNWKRALRAYEETNNPDFKPPETAQQEENEQ